MQSRSFFIFFIISLFFLNGSNSVFPDQNSDHNKSSFETSLIQDKAAHWISNDRLLWESHADAASFEIRYSLTASIRVTEDGVTGGTIIKMSPDAELNPEQADSYRHISHWPTFSVETNRQVVSEAIKGQVVAISYDHNNKPVAATNIQLPGVIDHFFSYQGELGLIYSDDRIHLKLWAPTAQSVLLKIYDTEKNVAETVNPVKSLPGNGVWEFEIDKNMDRYFYRFSIQVYHTANNKVNEYEVTDPWAVSLSMDSKYSQFIDLEGDARLKPADWDEIKKIQPKPVDITLYEAHIRDFSINDFSVPGELRGTYLAFTLNGIGGKPLSDGMAHLIRLRESGLTHLHLLPVNDIATIIENPEIRVDLDDPFSRLCEVPDHNYYQADCAAFGNRTIREVFRELANENPVNTDIQRINHPPGYSGLADLDGFNWGYDPFHFNTPQGSYSTQPEGAHRILEFRQMVKALYEAGLKLVVDVVYNHTNAAGLGEKSVLDKVVPGYYHRLNPVTGAVETSTCCQNTAAEHAMMEKLMIDSMVLWAKQYKVDSFRFDLMGHHPKSVMENIQDALAGLTLEKDGVDGANIYIYGEGWDFGEVAGNRIFEQATQFNMGGTGIGNFNDRIRDAIRGGNFTNSGRHQGFSSGMYLFPNEEADADDAARQALLEFADRIRVGMAGNLSTYEYMNRNGDVVRGGNEGIGYTLMPQESVNYIDKHDNETLWDNTQTKLPYDMGMDGRIRVHMLSNAFINYGQGVPFYQLGTDILRSKSLDRNSYDSGDWFNAVDFSLNTTNWAIGLPRADENEERWDQISRFLTNPNIQMEKEKLEQVHELFREQLLVRYSSPLFRLETAEQIHTRVAFHNTGPDQVPGIIAMTISDGVCAGENLDPELDGILVLFNADIKEQHFDAGLTDMTLHPIHKNSVDDKVQKTRTDNSVFTIPALTAAVFVKTQNGPQGEFPCNDMMGLVKDPGAVLYFQKPASWSGNVFLYTLNPEHYGSMPGAEMTEMKNDWYFTQLPDDVNDVTVIFSDESGTQTGELFRSGSGCYDIESDSWKNISECGLPGIEVVFKKPQNWDEKIHVYTFSPERNGSWPGEPMQKIENGWYRFSFSEGVHATNIIFNDASGNQTADLYREGSGCFVNGAWMESCEFLERY
ncbi:MAG: pullulanase-type alpha-1,6-glucosidase [Balneolaceae bacterium]